MDCIVLRLSIAQKLPFVQNVTPGTFCVLTSNHHFHYTYTESNAPPDEVSHSSDVVPHVKPREKSICNTFAFDGG